jgi:hypothetical protein
MKKVYLAPQTEAIEILANQVLMASPGGATGTGFTLQYGTPGAGGSPR